VWGLASVAGEAAEADLLAVVAARAGIGEDTLLDGLREAVAQQLVLTEAAGERYVFRHALVREAVYQHILLGERRRLHACMAEVLQERHRDGHDARVLAELAHHWYAARDDYRALAAAVTAGRAAVMAFAPAEGVRQFERAIALWDRCRTSVPGHRGNGWTCSAPPRRPPI
jgi:predicted ATPase